MLQFVVFLSLPLWFTDDIKAKHTEIQTAYNNSEYQRKRKSEYPSIADQLDDLYHNGIDGWKATIKITKDKWSKP